MIILHEMTRLINFGTGEICDRLSILALKILHAERAGQRVEHFQAEQGGLLGLLAAKVPTHDAWRALFRLSAVNGALWTAEDQMRDLRGKTKGATFGRSPEEVERCAFAIQDLNDQRAKLIESINRTTGEHDGSEKTPPGEGS